MEKYDYIKEKELDSHPNPITGAKLKAILEQMNKSICDIKCPIEGHGTGFFCKIPYPDFFILKPVLITNNHVLNKEDIAEGKIIKFTLNNEMIHKEILITNKRKIFTDEKLDITIIELNLQEDSIEPDSFLEIDSKINCENPNKEFKNIDIYIIGNIQEYTYGKIKNIDEDGINIEHLCATRPGMSGSPIINLNNFKIIGIHKGAHPKKQCNLGTFLKEPIILFYKLKNTNLEIKNIKEENKIKKNEMNIDNNKKSEELNIKNIKLNDFIYIPFIGLSSTGKSTILNCIMGCNLLPYGRNECTKKGIIIKYWNKEFPVIRKTHLEKLKNIKEKCKYIFSPDEKIIGKGIEDIKKVLE